MDNEFSILVAEDEFLIALVLEEELRNAGLQVVGPCATLDACLTTIEQERVDGAILDVDLAGEQVFPVAERLLARGIPFVFHTGRGDQTRMRRDFPQTKICAKPMPIEEIIGSLVGDLRPRAA